MVVATDFRADCRTVNDTAVAYGQRLVDDSDRIATVVALAMEETLLVTPGQRPIKKRPTSIVDVGADQPLDVGQTLMRLLQPASWQKAVGLDANPSSGRS